MTKRMLIDATHPEETRVAVVNEQQVEEFDFESSTKKQLKGNIYLAKVTRVEPSLQAAFVDYGGERHGFLAFSEIHPDYYQIPQADRQLLEDASRADSEQGDAADADGGADEQDGDKNGADGDADEEAAEVYAEQARRRSRLLRGYKIQEVIKRRQIMLVQVVKEERGTKGAALTTYLSLAGRYSVLMPNTARGGGISRKIANPADRTRLKSIAKDIDVPEGMGLIIRTAGQERSKLEIRRDYEYSLRLWNDIREWTLNSIAPCTIHEEGALVKRALRDLYGRDVDEVLVEGEEGYRAARKVMSMLMPSRARRVKQYKDDLPLFHRYQIEEQLDALHSPVVQLRSGGSIVIHTTEALTAIDVNSGRSTRERNIEETALKTNLEAVDEIARQLRLRDLAGLVVIDFIDMAEMRNQRTVERRLRDAVKTDRARVQLSRISPFGLLELSRQRLRPSFLELSTQPCPTCLGSSTVRSVESAALQALRALELEGIKGASTRVAIALPQPVALYVLNQKRARLAEFEQRYGMAVEVRVDNQMISGQFELEVIVAKAKAEADAKEAATEQSADGVAATEEEGEGGRKRRRRRRRRRRSDEVDSDVEPRTAEAESETAEIPVAADAGADVPADVAPEQVAPPAEEEAKPARRRRRRSTRRSASSAPPPAPAEAPSADTVVAGAGDNGTGGGAGLGAVFQRDRGSTIGASSSGRRQCGLGCQ